MAVLDRDAIDCSTNENCELRENIEMMYSVKVYKWHYWWCIVNERNKNFKSAVEWRHFDVNREVVIIPVFLCPQLQIKSTDEFTTKICGRCSDIVVTSTMWYIRVLETQTNIQAALRLRNDINDSVGEFHTQFQK